MVDTYSATGDAQFAVGDSFGCLQADEVEITMISFATINGTGQYRYEVTYWQDDDIALEETIAESKIQERLENGTYIR